MFASNDLGEGQEGLDRTIVLLQVPDTHRTTLMQDMCLGSSAVQDNTLYFERMPHWRRKQFPRGRVPETNRPISAGGEDALAIRAKRGIAHRTAMPKRRWRRFTSCGVPNEDCCSIFAKRDAASIGTDYRFLYHSLSPRWRA